MKPETILFQYWKSTCKTSVMGIKKYASRINLQTKCFFVFFMLPLKSIIILNKGYIIGGVKSRITIMSPSLFFKSFFCKLGVPTGSFINTGLKSVYRTILRLKLTELRPLWNTQSSIWNPLKLWQNKNSQMFVVMLSFCMSSFAACS